MSGLAEQLSEQPERRLDRRAYNPDDQNDDDSGDNCDEIPHRRIFAFSRRLSTGNIVPRYV